MWMLERKPRVVTERGGRCGSATTMCTAVRAGLMGEPSVNGRGYTSKMPIGKLLHVGAEEQGAQRHFWDDSGEDVNRNGGCGVQSVFRSQTGETMTLVLDP